MSLYSIEDAAELVQSFLDCTLNKYDWTHEAHLVVALHMVTHHAEPFPHMREAILRFNESVGTANTDTTGYHETMTMYWLQRVKQLCTAPDGTLTWDQDTLDHMLFHRGLSNRNVWLEDYTEEQMKSVEARRRYVAPDVK